MVKYILNAILLVLFLSYYIGTTEFTHIHFIDGVVESHSHPYSSEDDHDHSSATFYLIQNISSFHALFVNPFFGITAYLFTSLVFLIRNLKNKAESSYLHFLFLRPPPVF